MAIAEETLKEHPCRMVCVNMTHTKCMAVIIALVWGFDASSAVTQDLQEPDPTSHCDDSI